MMGGEVTPKIPLYGTREVRERRAGPTLGFMLILPLYLVLLLPWMALDAGTLGSITGADIAVWPYSVGILFKFTAFLGTLHWPVNAVDVGHCRSFLSGGSYPFRAMGWTLVAQ